MYIEPESDNVTVLEATAKTDDALLVVGVPDSEPEADEEDPVSVGTDDELEAGGVEDEDAGAGACELAAG